MKNLLMHTIIVLSCAILIVSCSKENDLLQETQNTPISVLDGRLVFDNQEVFDETVQSLLKQQDQLAAWKQQFDYTSVREAYEAITEAEKEKIGNTLSIEGYEAILKLIKDDNGEIEAVPTVGNNIFEMLYNHQGILQIGKKILKQDYDYLKIITDGDMSKLDMLSTITETNTDLGIEVYPVTHTIAQTKGTYGFDHPCSDTWSSKRRYKGMTSYDNNGIWMSLNAYTKNQKKSWGIWWLSKANFIKLEVDYDYTFNEREEPLHTWSADDKSGTYTDSDNNESKLQHTFEYCSFWSNDECYVETNTFDGTHTVKARSSGTGSSMKSCNTVY